MSSTFIGFLIAQQAVAQRVFIVDHSIRQQLVAQLMNASYKVRFYG